MATLGTITYPAAGSTWGKDQRGLSMRVVFDYAGPGAGAGGYVTGGDTILPGQIKLGTIEKVDDIVAPSVAGTTAVLYHFNLATQKMQAFWTGAGTDPMKEVTSGTDLSGFVGYMIAAEGRG